MQPKMLQVLFFCGLLFGIQAIEYWPSARLEDETLDGFLPEVCQNQLSGKDWILYQRRRDYGWGQDTHRAVIALAVDDFSFLNDTREGPFIIRQLQVEITKALLSNTTGQLMHPSDLALYIHALLSVKMNPRHFHGEDLVAKLEHIVKTDQNPLPLTVLALCNAGVVKLEYLDKIYKFLTLQAQSSVEIRELQAIALKAVACAVESDPSLYRYRQEMDRWAEDIYRSLWTSNDRFGNVYTTALVTQALVAANYSWYPGNTIKYLTGQLGHNANMLSTYSILLALNCERVRFIKDLSPKLEPLLTEDGFPSIAELRSRPRTHYVQYTIRETTRPDIYFTVTLKIPYRATMFDIMRMVATEDERFRFQYSLNNGRPEIYSLCGIPNDPENAYYWRLLLEDSVDHYRHTSNITEIYTNSNEIYPAEGSHWTYLYANMFEELPKESGDPNIHYYPIYQHAQV